MPLPPGRFVPAVQPSKGWLRSALLLLAPALGLSSVGASSAGAWSAVAKPHASQEAPDVHFQREILPILKGSCWDCHGPDKQKGGLRLDSRTALLEGGDGGPAFVPGAVESSELLRRVGLPPDHEDFMPARGDGLAAGQVAALRRWIEAGAPWSEENEGDERSMHWAYQAPVRAELPATEDQTWGRTGIDAFVLARLEREGLAPSPAAEPATLVRRLYLDLIGLPPSPEELDEFLRDERPDAYEQLVERLLASPEFGVRWARPWLDLARYADSHGFQADDLRDLWAYRDWVVDALNADMPFDRFTIEQLAGDLLPEPTLSQRIATGFNRSAPCNVELGSDPEETRVAQVFDRVNTLGAVWLGSTLECAQCHDHKYDPFTERDYYGMFAFFDQTEIEAERLKPEVPGSIQFLGPALDLLDPEVEAERAGLQARRDEVAARLGQRRDVLAHADPAWEAGLLAAAERAPREHRLALEEFSSLGGSPHEVLADGSILLGGEVPEKDTYTLTATTERTDIFAFKLETLTDPSLPGSGPGRGDARRPAFLLHEFTVTAAPAGADSPDVPVRLVRASADYAQNKYEPGFAIDGNPTSAWAIGPRFHEPHWAVFESAEPLGFERGTRFSFRLEQNSGVGRTIGRLRLSVLTGPRKGTPIPEHVLACLRTEADARDERQRQELADYRVSQDAEHAELVNEISRLEAEMGALRSPTTLVMREVAEPRTTRLLQRGDFRSPGEPIAPAVPTVLPPLRVRDPVGVLEAATGGPADDGLAPREERRPDRLDLARWLVAPENPLVARVTVNRWWAELFGHGLVATPEDFGLRGEAPTHPELLDWLALELVHNGWSMKRLVRTMVCSSTYRQNSRMDAELLERDGQNTLYARGPRFRMEAERIRDNALALAGLLDTTQGGPPIRPWQPPGLWSKVGGKIYEYEVSPEPERHRRGLYVVWKRSAPYPSFVNFDAGARMTCQVKRARSNTALQALTLMNDPVYVEAAVAFAQRVLRERPAATPEERIEHAFRIALARTPRAEERATLLHLYRAQLEAGKGELALAREFVAASRVAREHSPPEFKAWYAVAATLLNLDETISR